MPNTDGTLSKCFLHQQKMREQTSWKKLLFCFFVLFCFNSFHWPAVCLWAECVTIEGGWGKMKGRRGRKEKRRSWRSFYDAESLKNYRLPVQDREMRVPSYSSCLPRSHWNSNNFFLRNENVTENKKGSHLRTGSLRKPWMRKQQDGKLEENST